MQVSRRAVCAFLLGLALALGSLAPSVVANDHEPVATVERQHPLNHPPSAQAGAPLIVVDGGPLDEDGTENGQAGIQLDGSRSSDPDGDRTSNAHLLCDQVHRDITLLDYSWYEGGHEGRSMGKLVATGSSPILPRLNLGWQNFTLAVEDPCDARDLDHVHGFVAQDKTRLDTYTFDATQPTSFATTGIAHETDACNVDAEGSYLAFNLGINETSQCHYHNDQPVQGTATFTYDPGSADVLAIEFDTRFDTRDGFDNLQEELFGAPTEDILTVQASLDGGNTWTKANHTFTYDRLDEDLDDEWHRAGGLYDVSDRSPTDPDLRFRFAFDSRTAADGGGYGWLVDNIRLTELNG
jgi:hypothetical protein